MRLAILRHEALFEEEEVADAVSVEEFDDLVLAYLSFLLHEFTEHGLGLVE